MKWGAATRRAVVLCIAVFAATACGCSARRTQSSPPAAPPPVTTSQSSTRSASPADIAQADATALDAALGNDGDGIMNRVDARKASVPLQIVAGTIVDSVEIVSVEDEVVWIDTGHGKPVSIVLNQFTKLAWPASWGRYVADPDADTPAVKLPPLTQDSLLGVKAVAHVRVLRVPGITRIQAYAVDFQFLGK